MNEILVMLVCDCKLTRTFIDLQNAKLPQIGTNIVPDSALWKSATSHMCMDGAAQDVSMTTPSESMGSSNDQA